MQRRDGREFIGRVGTDGFVAIVAVIAGGALIDLKLYAGLHFIR